MHIPKGVHHLPEICARQFIGEPPSLGNKVEQFASSNILQDDGETFISSFIFVLVHSVLPHIHQLHNVVMFQLFHDTELVLEGAQIGSLLIPLNRILIAVGISH